MSDNNMNLLKQKEFEDGVMSMFLSGDNKILQKLRDQYKQIEVTDRDLLGLDFIHTIS